MEPSIVIAIATALAALVSAATAIITKYLDKAADAPKIRVGAQVDQIDARIRLSQAEGRIEADERKALAEERLILIRDLRDQCNSLRVDVERLAGEVDRLYEQLASERQDKEGADTYIDILVGALRGGGMEVPPRPSFARLAHAPASATRRRPPREAQ